MFEQKQASGNGGGGGLRTTAKFGGDEEYIQDLTNDDYEVALKLHLEELDQQKKNQCPYNRHNPFDMRIRTNAPLVDICESADDPDIIAAIKESQLVDPDKMSYEQLLELGEKIGSVSKGLS